MLLLRVILNEWRSTKVVYLGHCLVVTTYMTGSMWNCCCLGMICVHHTTMHHHMSLHAKPQKQGACLLNCNLPPALLADWSECFTCYCSNMGGGTDTEVTVSTESWPWRRKLSRWYCQDLNPQPFGHKFGAITTELSLLSILQKKILGNSVNDCLKTFFF